MPTARAIPIVCPGANCAAMAIINPIAVAGLPPVHCHTEQRYYELPANPRPWTGSPEAAADAIVANARRNAVIAGTRAALTGDPAGYTQVANDVVVAVANAGDAGALDGMTDADVARAVEVAVAARMGTLPGWR